MNTRGILSNATTQHFRFRNCATTYVQREFQRNTLAWRPPPRPTSCCCAWRCRCCSGDSCVTACSRRRTAATVTTFFKAVRRFSKSSASPSVRLPANVRALASPPTHVSAQHLRLLRPSLFFHLFRFFVIRFVPSRTRVYSHEMASKRTFSVVLCASAVDMSVTLSDIFESFGMA